MKLQRDFYLDESVTNVASSLLGKKLMVHNNGQTSGGIIVEAEAYSGAVDRASHAFKNKITDRTRVMFEEGGRAYVYLCYGIHHLFNIVTNREGEPDAVLIRAVQPANGIENILIRRNSNKETKNLTNGPGKVTAALGIDLSHNGIDLVGDTIWIEDTGNNLASRDIVASRRIGVDYAGKDAELPWRFYIRNNSWISKK